MSSHKQIDNSNYFSNLSLSTIIIVFGGLISWAVLAPYDGAVIASGKLVVETHQKVVQHPEGGLINKLHISEGELVKKGQLLISLSTVNSSSELIILNNRRIELVAINQRLQALIQGDTELVFPKELISLTRTPSIKSLLDRQTLIFQTKLSGIRDETIIRHKKIQQQKYKIEGLTAQSLAAENEQALILVQLEELKNLFEKGYVSNSRIISLKRDAVRFAGSLGQIKALIAEIHEGIGNNELEILRIKNIFLDEMLYELQENNEELLKNDNQITVIEDAIEKSKIYSPRAGRVINLKISTIGAVIAPRQVLMNIVPIDDKLSIIARIAPADIDKVQTGSKALIRFTAFNRKTTPISPALVTMISADVIFDTARNEEYYEATLALTEDISILLHGRPLVPGMPIEVHITTENRNAISYLLQPLEDALARTFKE